MDQGIDRQALHCYSLSFPHPFDAKRLSFELPLAEDMADIAKKR
jgi:23S rRNA pseudouridine1911/1915/1917 synthase